MKDEGWGGFDNRQTDERTNRHFSQLKIRKETYGPVKLIKFGHGTSSVEC